MPTGVPVNDFGSAEFWKSIALWLGWVLSIVFGFLAKYMWGRMTEFRAEVQGFRGEVQAVKEEVATLITRVEFNSVNAENKADRTDNFIRLNDQIAAGNERHAALALTIEQRLGDVLVKIAELRPTRRQEGPERRTGY